MQRGKNTKQPEHDEGRAEDRLTRRLGLEEGHGSYLGWFAAPANCFRAKLCRAQAQELDSNAPNMPILSKQINNSGVTSYVNANLTNVGGTATLSSTAFGRLVCRPRPTALRHAQGG